MLAIGLLTTNQAVGGSTPSGRANIACKTTGYDALSGRFFCGCPIELKTVHLLDSNGNFAPRLY